MQAKNISSSVKKKDHDGKVSGQLAYIGDVKLDSMLYGLLYRSPIAYGKIRSIKLPPMPEGYMKVGAEHIPGANFVKLLHQDQPIFADEWVHYIGEPMFMLVGPKLDILHGLAAAVEVDFEEHPAVCTLEEAIALKDQTGVFASHEFGERMDVIQAIEATAHRIIEETYETGYQEHVYLEPQSMLGIYEANGIRVEGSMQCLYYVKNALISALSCADDEVRVVQSPTGGGFGGKEDFPSLMACHVGIAAKAAQQPVMLLYDRHEDFEVTTKRHPAKFNYRTAIDDQGRILSMTVELFLDGGANAGLSPVVLQRALLNSAGVYRIPHFHAKGYALRTNTVPNGAFRGFGAPQSFAAIESVLGHISKDVNQDPIAYKRSYVVRQGDPTITGGRFKDPVLMDDMIQDLLQAVDYAKKRTEFNAVNKHNKRYKKGIGASLFLHGCGFTGSGERDHIRAIVKLAKTAGDRVQIKISNSDMGQGAITTMCKIVAHELELPYDDVSFPYPDTRVVPDSGPTVASRTTMIVGKLLERAARKLKGCWQAGAAQEVVEHYVHEQMIPWDEAAFTGDAYPAYSWGVNIVELEADTLTGNVRIDKVYGSFDIGKAIDEQIVKGQIDGGMAQGLAYGYMEKMTSKLGKIQQKSISDYGPPTSMDVVRIDSKLYDNPFAGGPYGAKGVGELPLTGGAPAVQAAIEDALQLSFYHIPVTPELIIDQLSKKAGD
ncbi:xanthine dehydrogenase family protein molybdopterin-binding subunit [Paenibacillus silvisoli]|uniref:xanthine dehydrogenase family protein molybdopterin-binding subunit n=1 Tax=Paenibacillus silvisoli TaxID=3110539 RepID=UPI0028040C9A|nr:xanthine dehydrogenase family protein molybdopterin-binding subunit [Paenibacillus silvisoli]